MIRFEDLHGNFPRILNIATAEQTVWLCITPYEQLIDCSQDLWVVLSL